MLEPSIWRLTHFIHDQVVQNSFFIQYKTFEDQLVDSMTKAFPATWFSSLHYKLTLLPQLVSLKGDVRPDN